jgi:hypothetical protein
MSTLNRATSTRCDVPRRPAWSMNTPGRTVYLKHVLRGIAGKPGVSES